MYNLYNFLIPFSRKFYNIIYIQTVKFIAIIYRYPRKIHVFTNLIIIRYTKEAL